MTLPNQEFLALEQSVGTIEENPSFDTTQKDPLISQGLQDWQYVGIFALALSALVLIRVLSPRAEHAILFALILSVILIILFFTV